MATASTPAPACSSDGERSSPQSAQDILNSFNPGSAAGVYATTVAYVAQFYPLWFTYYQAQVLNKLVGPDRVTPIYNSVVLINVDTVYASAFLDLRAGPVVLTVPETPVNYSILLLDPYGDIFQNGAPAEHSGVYALTGPGFSGALPPGVTPVTTLLNAMTLIFRADRYAPASSATPYADETAQANTFRASLKLQTLSDYLSNPNGGAAAVQPEEYFAFPFKLTADELIARDPIEFLRMLQVAVASPRTPPMTPFEQALSSRFDGFCQGSRQSV